MKKISFIIVTVFILLNMSFAQNNNQFALKAGFSFSDYADKKVEYHISPTLGINYNYHIANKFFAQIELLYKSEIYKYDQIYNKDTESEIIFFENLKLNYLQIPLLLKYNYLIILWKIIQFIIAGEQPDSLQEL